MSQDRLPGESIGCRSHVLVLVVLALALILSFYWYLPVQATPFEYPYPYEGPFTTTVPASWGLDQSASIPFQLPAADIRNGELLSTNVKATIPYSPITSDSGFFSNSGVAQVIDTWDLKIPQLNWDRPFSGTVIHIGEPDKPFDLPGFVNQIGGTGPAVLTFNDGGPPPGASIPSVPHFDRNNAGAYTLASVPLGGPGPITGTFTVSSSVQNGVFSAYHYDNPITVTVAQQFRQWNSEDLVAGRLQVTSNNLVNNLGLSFMSIDVNGAFSLLRDRKDTGQTLNFGFTLPQAAILTISIGYSGSLLTQISQASAMMQRSPLSSIISPAM